MTAGGGARLSCGHVAHLGPRYAVGDTVPCRSCGTADRQRLRVAEALERYSARVRERTQHGWHPVPYAERVTGGGRGER